MKGQAALSQEPNFPEDNDIQTPAAGDEFAGYESYFSTQDKEKFYLPDGKQYFVLKHMSERDRAALNRATRQSTTIDSKTRDMRIDLDDTAQRHEAVKAATVGWHLVRFEQLPGGGRRGGEVHFSQTELLRWLDDADPSAVDAVFKHIRQMNPWLGGEEDLDDLREQREDLTKRIAELEDEEARKGSSAHN